MLGLATGNLGSGRAPTGRSERTIDKRQERYAKVGPRRSREELAAGEIVLAAEIGFERHGRIEGEEGGLTEKPRMDTNKHE
jgi:hypothetical protein